MENYAEIWQWDCGIVGSKGFAPFKYDVILNNNISSTQLSVPLLLKGQYFLTLNAFFRSGIQTNNGGG